MTTNNPFISLIKQFKNNDLTEDFLIAFTHINQLLPNLSSLYEESFLSKTDFLDEYDSDFEVIEEFRSQNYTCHPSTNLNSYLIAFDIPSNILHFFVNKLSSNLKRLYSSQRKKTHKEYNNNSNDLLQQQNIIYKCLSLMIPHVNHSDERFMISNTFLGKTKFETLTNTLYYLSFHQNISEHNFTTHFDLVNKLGINHVDTTTINNCLRLKFQKEHYAKYSPLFNLLNRDNIEHCNLAYINSDYCILLLLHIVKLEQDGINLLNHDKKNIIITSLFSEKNLIQKFSFEEFTDLIPKLRNFFKNNQSCLTKQTNCIDPSNATSHHFAYLLLSITDNPNVSYLYLDTLNEKTNMPTHLVDIIFEKHPITKTEDLIPLVNSFHKITKKEEQQNILINLLNKFQTIINPEIISYMFGKLPANLFPILIKFSHKFQIEKEFNIQSINNEIKTDNHKKITKI